MTSYKRFTGSTNGNFIKWETPGQTVEGAWVGWKKGTYGPLLTINIAGEDTEVGCPSGLVACIEEAFGSLANVPTGTKMQIEFVKAVPVKGQAQPFKKFEIGVDESSLPTDTVPC